MKVSYLLAAATLFTSSLANANDYWACTRDGQTLKIEIVWADAPHKLPCEVRTLQDNVAEVLMHEEANGDICRHRAAQLIRQYDQQGWNCAVKPENMPDYGLN